MQFDETPGESQPEAGALALADVVVADLAKLLEDRRLVLRGDADARVADRDLDPALRAVRANADAAAFGRELHGVGEEVQQDLLDLPLVADDWREIGLKPRRRASARAGLRGPAPA